MGGPGTDVEDIVQEVFLAAHRKLAGFRGDSSPSTWLYRITLNVIRHRRRKERWRRWLGGSAAEVAGDVAAAEPSPLESADARQASEKLYRALDGMKEKYRTVLILFEIDGLSGDEVAAVTGAKVATVWVWLHRARAELARRLDPLYGKESE